MLAFYRKQFSVRQKQISKPDDFAPADEAKVGAMINAINNMNNELGQTLRHFEDIGFKAQDCVHDSWQKFEQTKIARVSEY